MAAVHPDLSNKVQLHSSAPYTISIYQLNCYPSHGSGNFNSLHLSKCRTAFSKARLNLLLSSKLYNRFQSITISQKCLCSGIDLETDHIYCIMNLCRIISGLF